MGATSVTGVGQPSADGFNKGAAPETGYQTLGHNHIIDMPQYGIIYTEYPGDGNFNSLGTTAGNMATLETFKVAIQSFPFYLSDLIYVESALITSEIIIDIADDNGIIAGVTFTDNSNTNAPYPYRVINVNTFPVVGTATITWEWNGMIFYVFVQTN